MLDHEIVNESLAIDTKKLVYKFHSFLISMRHLLERFIYTLRSFKSCKIPKKVDECIKKLIARCTSLETSSFSEDEYNKVLRSNEYISLFHNYTIDDFDEKDFIVVDTRMITDKMKSLDKILVEKEKALLKADVYEINDSTTEYFNLQYKLYSTHIMILNKYFTFGKGVVNGEVIPLGANINADAVII